MDHTADAIAVMMPTTEELVRIGCEAAGIGSRDARVVEAWKGVTYCSNPDLWKAAMSMCYPERDEFGAFAEAVRDAVLDAQKGGK